MRIRSYKPLCGFVLVLLCQAGCGQYSATTNATAHNSSDADSAFSVANLSRAPVSISEVDVFSLVVANTRDNGVPARSFHFIATGASDFVEVQLCQPERGCSEPQKLVVDELLLSTPNAGKYVAQARACVFPGRALNSETTCGEWKGVEFEMSASTTPEIVALLDERDAKLAQINIYAKTMQQTLDTFLQESKACLSREDAAKRINAIRGIVQNYLSLGESLIGYALRKAEEKEASNYAGTPVTPVQKPLAENSEKLAKFMEYDTAIRKIAIARGYFDEALPVNAVQTLGFALFDIFTAKQQNSGVCLAKDKADREMASIAANIASLKTRISEIESQLSERSGQ